MNTKSSNFTSGEAQVQIPLLVYMSENWSCTEKRQIFCFFYALKLFRLFQRERYNFFTSHFASNLVPQAIVCKVLKNSRKFPFYKQFSRNLRRMNVYRRLRQPGPKVIKCFSCSTQLSMKFFLLIHVKMPTIVGILTCMSRKNSILGLSEPKKCWISWYFYTYENLKFHAPKSFITLGPDVTCIQNVILAVLVTSLMLCKHV